MKPIGAINANVLLFYEEACCNANIRVIDWSGDMFIVKYQYQY